MTDTTPQDLTLLPWRLVEGFEPGAGATAGGPLAAQADYLRRLSGTRTQRETMQVATDEVCRRLGCDVSWVGTVEHGYLVMGAARGLQSSEMAVAWRLKLGQGIGGRVATDGRPSVSRDYRHDSRRVPLMTRVIDEEGIRSLVSVPLLSGDQVLGVLYGARREVHDWSPAEVAEVTEVGRDLAVRLTVVADVESTVRRLADAEQDLAAMRGTLRTVQHLVRSFTRGEDVRRGIELLAHDLQMTVELRDADGWVVHLVTEGVPQRSRVRWRADVGPRDSHALAVVGDHDLSDAQAAMAQTFAALITLQMARAQERSTEELRLTSRFFDAVLAGRGGDLREFVADASLLGLDLRRPAFVAVAGRTGDDLTQRALTPQDVAAATGLLAARFPGSVVTPREGDLLAIVFTEDGARSVAAVMEAQVLPGLGARGQWVAGVGGRVETVGDYAAAYREAGRALAFVRSSAGGTDVAIASDLGTWGLGDGTSEPAGRQVEAALGPLLRSDATGGTEYVPTLEAYLRNDRNLNRTAAALHVHANTVRYRVTKIEELLRASLRDVDDRFRLESALRLRGATRKKPTASAPE
ncbi:helix-turn-helix domain-containing protein [Modestobacter versicolor]|uniref:helix-turn-helix domain-containing protein n=1 Tax=Modestobacter versicolor TaxID=429133 RepID=UPI0034E01FB1